MFRDAKVGDRVWSIKGGWGTITTIDSAAKYSIQVICDNGAFRTFTVEGKHQMDDIMPTLFWDEIQIAPPPKPKKKVKKTVDVWINFYPGNRHYIHYSKQAADLGFTGEGEPGELKAVPATLTYEIEE